MKLIKEEVTKNVISSIFTISIALGAFTLGNWLKSYNEYESLKQAVKLEAKINSEILNKSFTNENINRKTIIRDFSVVTIKSALSDGDFISHCDSLTIYFNYLLNLERMNGFKKFAEQSLVYPQMGLLFTRDQTNAWYRIRDYTEIDITRVIRLP